MQQSSASTRPRTEDGERGLRVPQARDERPPAPEGYTWETPDWRAERRSLAFWNRVVGWIVMIGTVVVGGMALLVMLMWGLLAAADTGDWSILLRLLGPILVIGTTLFFLGLHMTVYARRLRWQLDFAEETGLVPAVKARWDFVVSLGTFAALLTSLPIEAAVTSTFRAIQDPESTVSVLGLLFGLGLPLLVMGLIALFIRWGLRRQRRCPPLSPEFLAALTPPPRTVPMLAGAEVAGTAGMFGGP